MSSIEAFFLGIFQGITEFFPISSTGHLIAWQTIMQNGQHPPSQTQDVFDAVIQIGSGIALSIYFFIEYVKNRLQIIQQENLKKIFLYICTATMPTVICGMLFYSYIKMYLYSVFVVAWALIIGGSLFILVDKKKIETNLRRHEISFSSAFIIGLSQILALVPGVSRSGITIFTGIGLGISRREAITFSFLLATPILIGAGSYDLYKSLKTIEISDVSLELVVVGFLGSLCSSLLLAAPLLSMLEKVGLRPFGWYRVVSGLILLIYLSIKY